MEPEHPRDSPPSEPWQSPFPSLPIVTPDPPRKTEREKYGGLFYLSIVGLATLVGLIGYFAHGVWSLRSIWSNIFILHSSQRSQDEHAVQAAFALSLDPNARHPAATTGKSACRKPLPPLARYLMAECVTADTVAADPKAYELTVLRSEGWPDWLRVQLTRPLAYAAARGDRLPPRAELAELSRHSDPVLGLWADFARAASGDPEAKDSLRLASEKEGPNRELAQDLLSALFGEGGARLRKLDAATLWVRRHHAESARLWEEWEVQDRRLVRIARPIPAIQP